MSITTALEEMAGRIEALRARTLPKHVALIADGSGACRDQRAVLDLIFARLGIQYLTLLFDEEGFAAHFLQDLLTALEAHQVKLGFCSKHFTERPENQALFARVQTATRNFNRHHLRLGIACDSRNEILEAAKLYLSEKASGGLNGKPFDEEVFASYLSSAGIPDPDLIIRTGDVKRIPNALLWQMAYSEFFVTKKTWEAFDIQEWICALEAYQRRQRRFGNVFTTKE